MLSHTSRVSAVRTARPLLRAVLMRGADARRDCPRRRSGSGSTLAVMISCSASAHSRGRRRRTAASSAIRRGGLRRRRASARCGSRPRAGAPCSRRAPCSATSRTGRRRCVRASVLQHPGVLGAAALAGVHHQRALLQRHAREAARRDPHLVAREHEGPKVDMARRHAGLGEGGHRRKRQRRLGDVVAAAAP